jgi:exonuclease SbcD
MKIIHLADLHIGKTIYGVSLLPDQRHILDQILAHAEAQRPQAVVIAGDVYDKPTPGAEAVKLFDRFLTALSRLGCAVFIIGGNHDSPERLSFASGIVAAQNVFIQGAYDGELPYTSLQDAFGEVRFYLLPYIKPAYVRRFFEEEQIDTCQTAMRAVLEKADIDPAARNVLVTHQFYVSAGLEPIRSDSEIDPVGGLDAVDVSLLSAFDYVAMGHIHGPQRVGPSDNRRYAGSPLKYSFSEARQQKSLTLVELGEKGDVRLTQLPLTPLHDMRPLKGPLALLLSGALSVKEAREDYVQVTLTDEEELFGVMERVRGVYPNTLTIGFDNSRTRAEGPLSFDEPMLADSPFELFKTFYEERNGAGLLAAQEKIVQDILKEAGVET